ncbi:hypothetical protein IJJ39_02590, partial [Candidatus Saccharibacteria bacterium]|nr:hypothetical protein [Candidatus Saccharibacteria bacterium]
MKAIQKIKKLLKSISEGATSKVLFGHGVPAARRRWGRGSFCLVVTPTDSSKHSTSGSNISDSNNARRITNLVFRGLSGAYERGGRSASPVTTGASDSVSEKHLNGDSSSRK